jgi:hypothetical protein
MAVIHCVMPAYLVAIQIDKAGDVGKPDDALTRLTAEVKQKGEALPLLDGMIVTIAL